MADLMTMQHQQSLEQLRRHLSAFALSGGGSLDIRLQVPIRDILHRQEHAAVRILEPAKQLYEQVLVLPPPPHQYRYHHRLIHLSSSTYIAHRYHHVQLAHYMPRAGTARVLRQLLDGPKPLQAAL